MKALLFTLEYPPQYGGVANYYYNLAVHWPKEADAQLTVLDNSSDCLINPKLPTVKWLPSIFKLWQGIKKNNIDHVIVGQLLPLGTAAYLVSKILKIRYSVVIHGMDLTFAQKSKRKKTLSRKILNNAAAIICSNSCVADLTKQLIEDKNKVKVVNPGVDSDEYQNEKLEDMKTKYGLNNKIVLLGLGRLVKRKGFDMVIESLPETLKRLPDLVYVIAGKGEELNNLKARVDQLDIKDKVLFIEEFNDFEKNSWFSSCDIFIMPSRNIDGDFEGFGIVYLEANLMGKPVIAGDSGGVKDAVIDNLNGLLVNPENPGEIAQAIITLGLDKELRRRLGEQGRERAIRYFNWETKAKEFFKILDES